jgi:pimeloyl-ACP methyl ester carboxylesterase
MNFRNQLLDLNPKNKHKVKIPEDTSAKAVFSDWQKSGSPLVLHLSKSADVFSFAYGQNISLENIADAPHLSGAVKQLKDLGYSEIILIGHSAGGVLARLFIEDHAHAGVTKVIQVCAPNGGTYLAKLTGLAPKSQEAFMLSLTEESRELCSKKRTDKKVPPAIQFVCVVGKYDKSGDGVVTCERQWTEDLQRQLIPAVELATSHNMVMSHADRVKRLAQLVREDHPRWKEEQVRSFKQKLGAEEFSRGGFIAQLQSRASKARTEGDAEALVECAWALAPFDSLPGVKEHLSSVYIKQAAEITLAKNDQREAARFLDSAGVFQILLESATKNKVTTLACGKNLDDMLKGQVIASREPITRTGPDFFNPDVVLRGGGQDIAEALGKALVLAARPTAQHVKLSSYKIGSKKKAAASMEIEMDFHGGPASYRAKMTVALAYEGKRVRIVSVVYQDDWQVPWDSDRIEEYKSRFNLK